MVEKRRGTLNSHGTRNFQIGWAITKAKPLDSEINCPVLTELLDGSLKYLCAYFKDGWRHSEEAAAEEIRTRTLELLHSISADVLVRDMGTAICEFVVRLSRWVRE